MSDLHYSILKPEHAETLAELQLVIYPHVSADARFSADEFRHHAQLFPEGTIVVLDGARAVGMGAGLFIDFDFDHPQHTLNGIVGDGYYSNHDPHGEFYYGTEIAVHPDYRRRGIGRRIYELRKELVKRYNKRGIVAGGVLPGFADYKHTMSAADYVARVVAGELYDRTLTFQIENGFEVRGVLEEYYEYPRADNWASLIVWWNPEYQPRLAARRDTARRRQPAARQRTPVRNVEHVPGASQR